MCFNLQLSILLKVYAVLKPEWIKLLVHLLKCEDITWSTNVIKLLKRPINVQYLNLVVSWRAVTMQHRLFKVLIRCFNLFHLEHTLHSNWVTDMLSMFELHKNMGLTVSRFMLRSSTVLDFWWRLLWVSKPSGQPYLCYRRHTCYRFPRIYIWCNTWWPLDG